jgi:hypothetical protein
MIEDEAIAFLRWQAQFAGAGDFHKPLFPSAFLQPYSAFVEKQAAVLGFLMHVTVAIEFLAPLRGGGDAGKRKRGQREEGDPML